MTQVHDGARAILSVRTNWRTGAKDIHLERLTATQEDMRMARCCGLIHRELAFFAVPHDAIRTTEQRKRVAGILLRGTWSRHPEIKRL